MKKFLSYSNIDKNVELYVKQPNGRYKAAGSAEIFAGARAASDKLLKHGEKCNKTDSVKQFCIGKLSGVEHEVFGCLFLDFQFGLIKYIEPFSGTLAQTSVYIREIAKLALELNAGALIVTHNHPSGCLEPSDADKHLTERLQKTLALIDVKLVDHILVAGSCSMSFAERGLI